MPQELELRDLDIQVGELVFNGKVISYTGETKAYRWPRYFIEQGGTVSQLPSYSTNIKDAMRVFDAMIFRAGAACIFADVEDYGRGSFTGDGFERTVRVQFGSEDSDIKGYATGSLTEAICKAALKFIEEEQAVKDV